MKPVLVYTGDSRYRLFDTFSQDFLEGFRHAGVHVFEADLSGAWQEPLNQALGAEIQFAFSFNGIRAALNVGDKSWHDASGVPLIVMLLDHPLYHLDVIKEKIENMIILTVDRRHAKFIVNDLGDKRRCVFFPHGGMRAKGPEVERDIDVMFAGSLENPVSLNQSINELSAEDCELAKAIVALMMESHKYSIEEAGRQVGESQNHNVNTEWFFEKMPILTLADRMVRHSKRYRLLKLLAEENLLTAWGFGDGWDQLKDDVPQLDFRGEINTQEVLAMMKRSKICVNVLPGFMEGSHERVLSSMRNGCVTVSDRSKWLEETFVENEELLFFDWHKLDEFPGRLRGLLNDITLRRNIASSGEKKAEKSHGWEHRAEQLLKNNCNRVYQN